ncbi:PREDICTED: nardilysin-like isoform X1 [Trachymyrmex cornetzi]|uniref:nardilysin-like isoform X1 n=2 Tax=Trachymyrmex cornetzi TaxID=471704 RepID=UPI00084F7866|nr:PREDICTED: nardilysin-like isoform X1 [Trachymyrmex cornetzi]
MTRALYFFQQRLTIVRRVCRYVSVRLLRKIVQSLQKRKLKTIHNPIVSFPIGLYSTDRPNCHSDFPCVNIMPEVEHTTGDDERYQVEYLETPIKSENDKKEYRVIKLPNGLTALLISDIHSKTCASQDQDDQDKESEDETEDEESSEENGGNDDDENEGDTITSDEYDEEDGSSVKRVKRDEKKAACGLCVGVGSFSDPIEVQGMAHFLEHMVFMGSEKYPQENDFDAFISKRGGFTNASTDCEHTTFYFDIQEKHLSSALDRFAQFFIKPLMKKDAITREREAVESEFQLALPCDENRKEQLFSSFARTDHPANKFIWGNLITLRDNIHDDKLYEELHKFRKRHYSAHRMKLAIQARLPLDTLEKYVITCFADVPSNGLPPDDFTAFKDGISFDTPAFRKMYKVKPFKDVSQLELTWTMPSLLHLYKSKPHQYISWIIGHEGKGSLISYLRKKMWSLDIFSGSSESGFEHSSMYVLLKITIVLSYEGQQHLEEVLDAIFSFINLLKREGPQKRIYDEIYQIEENNFRFADEEDPADYVEDLCESMHFYPSRDYITGNELYSEYNPEAIQKCLDYLVPETVNIMIFNEDFDCLELNKVEPWFKTKYTDIEIPKEWIERWKSIEPLPEFHLPLENTFLTSDFSLIPLPAEVPKYPVKLCSNTLSEIWYRPDPKFRLPECYMNFHFVSPLGLQSPENAALMEMYCNVLKLLLIEELYPAIAAGFNYNISVSEKGITIKMNGFNEKLPLLLMAIAKYMVEYPTLVTKDLFEIVKVQQLKTYYNTFVKPGKLVRDMRLWILKLCHYTHVDMHTALRGINFEKFQDFVKFFTNHLYIQCLVQGNMTQNAANDTVRKCVKIINCDRLIDSMIPQIRITQIPVGTSCCKLKNINKIDANSVVTNYYQAGVTSIELSVLIDLMIMIMEEPLFNRLRTQEQLGYDVSCVLRDVNGILGYSITVHTQADKYTTEHVDQRIEEFLKSFNKILEEFSEEELDDAKEALRKLKQCADIDLEEEVNRNWHEITHWRYMFDRLEREVLAIKDIKINELREWSAKHTLNGSNFRKLSVHVVGTDPKESAMKEANNTAEDRKKAQYFVLEYITNEQNKEIADHHIIDVEKYKKKLFVYPVSEGISSPLRKLNK